MSVDQAAASDGGASAPPGATFRPSATWWPVTAVAGAVGGAAAAGSGGAGPPVASRSGGSRVAPPGAAPGAGPATLSAGPAPVLPPRPAPLAVTGPAAAGVAAAGVAGAGVAELGERAGVGAFQRAARSANTLAAYLSDWTRFSSWCARHGVSPLPAEPGVVAAYMADAANATATSGRSVPWRYSPATLARWVATINKAHDLAQLVAPGKTPEVRDTLAGIRRSRATPPARKTLLLLADLERLVAGIDVPGWPGTPGALRNWCLLVMGWVGRSAAPSSLLSPSKM